MPDATARVHEVKMVLNAPLEFCYRWCTDYSPEDHALEGSKAERKVIEQSDSRVVYEDLSVEPAGNWRWSRATVDLEPPNRWHAEYVGNYRSWSLDYELTPLDTERTQFHLRGIRRPMLLASENPPLKEVQDDIEHMWGEFSRHLEEDYRAGLGSDQAR